MGASSVVPILLNLPGLRESVSSPEDADTPVGLRRNPLVVRAVLEMLSHMDRGDAAVVDCTGLREALHGDGDGGFDVMDTQQDAMETLMFVWNEIGCQSMFAFVNTRTTTLLGPNGQTRTTDMEERDWSLRTCICPPLPAEIELGKLIRKCFMETRAVLRTVRCDADGCFNEDGTHEVKCSDTSTHRIKTAPQVLFVHIPRQNWGEDGKVQTLHTEVAFPEALELDAAYFVDDFVPDCCTYRLYAVHCMRQRTYGLVHSVFIRLVGSEQWYDTTVSSIGVRSPQPVAAETVLNGTRRSVWMLFYVRDTPQRVAPEPGLVPQPNAPSKKSEKKSKKKKKKKKR
jgi:hypothetical protein